MAGSLFGKCWIGMTVEIEINRKNLQAAIELHKHGEVQHLNDLVSKHSEKLTSRLHNSANY